MDRLGSNGLPLAMTTPSGKTFRIEGGFAEDGDTRAGLHDNGDAERCTVEPAAKEAPSGQPLRKERKAADDGDSKR